MVTGEYAHFLGIVFIDDDFDNGSFIEPELNSTYVHEKIHFIQNFSTFYGINKSLFTMSRYLESIRQVLNGNKAKSIFDDPESDFCNSSFRVNEGETTTVKCHSVQEIKYVDFYADFYSDEFPDKGDFFEKQVILKFHDKEEYHLGGDAICESMAYLIEEYLFETHSYEKTLPYNVCEMIYEYVVGEKCNDMLILIALSYVSLMTVSPGNSFIKLLYKIKTEKSKLLSMMDVFDFANEYVDIVSDVQLRELYKRVDMAFPTDADEVMMQEFVKPFMDDLIYTNNWMKEKYNYLISNALSIRQQLIHILELPSKRDRINEINEFLYKYANILVIDRKGKVYPKEEKGLVFLLAPWALQETLLNGNKSCIIRNICDMYGIEKNSECSSCWWRRILSAEVCIMRFYLYAMGLGDKDLEELL